MHDTADTANGRVFFYLTHGGFLLAPGILQRFQRYGDTDLISVFEAICESLCDVVYLDRSALNTMFFDAGREGGRRVPADAQRRVFELGLPSFFREGQPDHRWRLSGQAMERQCRQQTDNAVRNPGGNLGKGVMRREVPFGKHVEATAMPFQEALVDQPNQVFPWDMMSSQVPGPQDAGLAGEG